MWTAYSPADPADYAEECSRAALFRRQKTASANVSAKADAADNAEKDSYHIVECCSCLYNKSVREHACSFLVHSLLAPYVFNGRSHGNILQMNTEPSLLELCWVQLDIHAINKMQKQKKFRANEYRVKFTWTMLSAAEILYQRKTASIAHVVSENWHETTPKGAKKSQQKSS